MLGARTFDVHPDLARERQLVCDHRHRQWVALRVQQAITALFELEATSPFPNGVSALQ